MYNSHPRSSDTTYVHTDIPDNQVPIAQTIAAVLLKLENIFYVTSAAFSELLEELHYLLSTTFVMQEVL